MKHKISHTLDIRTSTAVARAAMESYRQKFAKNGVTVTWQTEQKARLSFSINGMTILGECEVLPGCIELNVEVPFALKLFERMAVTIVEKEVRDWLDRARRGEFATAHTPQA